VPEDFDASLRVLSFGYKEVSAMPPVFEIDLKPCMV